MNEKMSVGTAKTRWGMNEGIKNWDKWENIQEARKTKTGGKLIWEEESCQLKEWSG